MNAQLLDGLKECFLTRFAGLEPRFCVTAPGRINLIGEHTDYNGFPVMPLAIDRAVHMLGAPHNDGVVELHDVQSDVFGPRRFAVGVDVEPYEMGDWGNYAKAAVQSLARHRQQQGREVGELKGMRCILGGDVPRASGVASSSALVIACGLAFMASNAHPDEPSLCAQERCDLAERMALAEHYVGTQGGGMDQAVCLTARADCVVKIDFFPLTARPVPFPADYVVVAAHSTVHAAKACDKRLEYNRRVLECHLGHELLASHLGRPGAERLADLCRPRGPETAEGLREMLSRILEGRKVLSLPCAADLFGLSPEEFADRRMRMKDGSAMAMPQDGLKVLPRCRHVLTEAQRVEQAVECIAGGEMTALGKLMDASHESCARDYEVSIPELDRLTELIREAGALGSRLTGAGFGGFAIGLVGRGKASAVRDRLAEQFYEPRGIPADENIFFFTPCAGASGESLPT